MEIEIEIINEVGEKCSSCLSKQCIIGGRTPKKYVIGNLRKGDKGNNAIIDNLVGIAIVINIPNDILSTEEYGLSPLCLAEVRKILVRRKKGRCYYVYIVDAIKVGERSVLKKLEELNIDIREIAIQAGISENLRNNICKKLKKLIPLFSPFSSQKKICALERGGWIKNCREKKTEGKRPFGISLSSLPTTFVV